jgi:hypothetical protein
VSVNILRKWIREKIPGGQGSLLDDHHGQDCPVGRRESGGEGLNGALQNRAFRLFGMLHYLFQYAHLTFEC